MKYAEAPHNYAALIEALRRQKAAARGVRPNPATIPVGLGTNEAGPKVVTNPTPNAWDEGAP